MTASTGAIREKARAAFTAQLQAAWGRCQRYARQRGWAYDPKRSSIEHLTPRQRKRALKKERAAWPGYSRRAIDMPWNTWDDGERDWDGALYESLPTVDHGDFEYGYDGHSPADEYFIWPRDDSPSYGDSFAY